MNRAENYVSPICHQRVSPSTRGCKRTATFVAVGLVALLGVPEASRVDAADLGKDPAQSRAVRGVNVTTLDAVTDSGATGLIQRGGQLCPPPDPTDDPCQDLAGMCFTGTADDSCRPTMVQVQGGLPFAVECACLPLGDKCGAIDIIQGPAGDTIIACPGGCPSPNPSGLCEVHLDGVPTGSNSVQTSAIPPGVLITCDCPGGAPEPDPHQTVDPTNLHFGTLDVPVIPADFFGPGADPFGNTVQLQGGPNDTLIQRMSDANCPPLGACDPIDIEIVELNLVSVGPVTVSFNSGASFEDWDLAIGLSGGAGSGLGSLQPTKTHPNGGSYDAQLPILPRLTFTKVINPLDVRVLDYDPEGLPPIELNFFGVPWVVNLGPLLQGNVDAPSDGNFVPGVDELVPGDPNSQAVVDAEGISKGGGVDHTVRLLTYCDLPGDPATDPCGPLQKLDCEGSPADLCLGHVLQVLPVPPGGVDTVECACFADMGVCGPIFYDPDADAVRCPGNCLSPEIDPCQIWVDPLDGTLPFPTGKTEGPLSQFPDGALLWCDCAPACTTPADCDDNNPCTTDVCLADGTCVNTPDCPPVGNCDDNNACTTDTCDANGCCVNTPDCTSDADCDDNDICTTDTCDANGCCVNTPDCTSDADCDDGDPCTTDTCRADGCCDNIPDCTVDTDCNDGNACTTDTCDPVTQCCVFTPECATDADCDDGDPCTTDTCRADGCCDNIPDCTSDADCDDGNTCTTDTCDPATQCCVFTLECTTDADCDDGDPCTIDTCRADGCCDHQDDPACWYWKDYNGPDLPGGYMPDYDQNKDYDGNGVPDPNYCGPTAVGNSIWWFHHKFPDWGVVPAGVNKSGLIQDLAGKMATNDQTPSPNGHIGPYAGTYVDDMQSGIDDYLNANGLVGNLYEHTEVDPDFNFIASEVQRSQDVVLLLGFYHIEFVEENPPGSGNFLITWRRVGGHYVTVAGVNKTTMEIAISDPDADAAEFGAPGVVRPGGVDHDHDNDGNPATGPPPFRGNYDHYKHNDKGMASHDFYALRPSFSPGGQLALVGAGDPLGYAGDITDEQSMASIHQGDAGGEFMVDEPTTVTMDFLLQNGYPPPQFCQTYTEIEYAVVVSPKQACCVGDGSCFDVLSATDLATCLALGGNLLPPGSSCAGVSGACCYDSDGDGVNETCTVMDRACCDDLGGDYLGDGTVCLGDLDGDGIDDSCAPQCGPNADETACVDFVCPGPLPPIDTCQPRCIEYDPLTGAFAVKDCDCRQDNECHAQFIQGTTIPQCVGPCEDSTEVCRETRTFDALTGLETLCCDCEPSNFEVCPLVLPPADDPCEARQTTDCVVDELAGEDCRPIVVQIQNGVPVAVLCDCIPPGKKCGPVEIIGDAISCPGGCPPPNLDENCVIWVDGHPIGRSTASSTDPDIPEGADITCDCAPVPPRGACCFDADGDGIDETCAIMTSPECTALLGTYHGDGTLCGSVGACCFDADGDGTAESCAEIDSTCCEDIGGTFNGTGSVCLGDSDGNGIDDACDCDTLPGEVIRLRSGNGPIGGLDSDIHVLQGPPGVPLSSGPLVPAHFIHACALPQADVIAPHPVWLAGTGGSLPSDPLAQWIAADPAGALPNVAPHSALYCHEFEVCCPDPTAATLEITYAVDDQLGDTPFGPNNIGVYINNTPVSGMFGVGFWAPISHGPTPIPLVSGANTLHIYQRDTQLVASGTIYSATVRVTCATEACCFPDGHCEELDPCCCADLGGTPLGAGTVCDTDGDGIDDACPCDVDDTQTGCVGTCADATAVCQPRCVNYDASTGTTTVTDCDCRGTGECHVDTATPGARVGDPCVVTDVGGTVVLPPIGCDYLSPEEFHEIVAGLPNGTVLELAAIHRDFMCRGGDQNGVCSVVLPAGECEQLGGTAGGHVDCFDSVLEMNVTSTGPDLIGFNRTVFIPASVEVHTGPRTPGDAVQDFDTEMVALQGELFPDTDPDFCTLRIVAGTRNGLPSPGHTTLTDRGDGNFTVDSFFDVHYKITFEGCPGSQLEGMMGDTEGTIRMQTGSKPTCVGGCEAPLVCEETRTVNADGTIDLCCDCVEPTGACCLAGPSCVVTTQSDCESSLGGVYQGDGTNCDDNNTNGIPDECEPDACGPSDDGSGCEGPCPATGCFGECINGAYCDDPNCCLIPGQCMCYLPWTKESIKYCGDCFGECIDGAYCDAWWDPNCCIGGTGTCACYSQNSDISIQLCNDNSCFGECVNGAYCDPPDPDCCIVPGACACYDATNPISIKMCGENLPTVPDRCEPKCVDFDPLTGEITVTDCGCVEKGDCHVDIPTPVQPGVRSGDSDPCVVVDAGSGTVELPPVGCEYLSAEEVHEIIDDNSGAVFELAPIHKSFVCDRGVDFSGCPPPGFCEEPGGTYGGNVDCFESILEMRVTIPSMPSFSRTLFVPTLVQVETAPRTPGDEVQDFETRMNFVQGDLFGDPDFCTLSITGGDGFGLPSPGHTTLTRLGPPGSDFAVDSFFDITFRIVFEGCVGSQLEGMVGDTTGTIRMETGGVPDCVGTCPPGETCIETQTVDPATGKITVCCECGCPPVNPLEPDPRVPDIGFGTRNRYLCFVAPQKPEPEVTAIRVTFTDLPPEYEAYEGDSWWVGEPVAFTENSGSSGSTPLPTFLGADLLCGTKFYADWASYDEPICVYNGGIVGDSTYTLEAIPIGCDQGDPGNYSIPLTIQTSKLGDIVGTCAVCPCTPPQGVINFVDISAVVDKFKNLACSVGFAPGVPQKSRADIVGNSPSAALPNRKVDFVDIGTVVDAFRSNPPTPSGPQDHCTKP